jgi:starch synthase
MVALEAMERARPVIASAVGGLPEIVADGETGLVVQPGDAEALADAIASLAGDLERAAAMGRAGRARALTEFTPERSAQRIEDLYRVALGSDGA